MATWAFVVMQILLAVPVGGALALPGDNDMSRYRHEPAMFHMEWDSPVLLNGKAAGVATSMDTALYSMNTTYERTLADYLYPSDSERQFMGSVVVAWCRRRWWVSYAASTCYLISLWAGTASMRERKPYDLKAPLACWNLFLTVFSFIGMMRTVPHLLLLLRKFGLTYTVCRCASISYGNGASGFWVAAFIFSKYFELADTVFLVARKRKVNFLHWYHHCSVLLYCWHAFVWEMPTGIFFVAINYSVHAIMYFYYFLAATCSRPPSWGLLVTILQLAQMAVGIMVTLFHLSILVYGTVPNCDGHIPNLAAALGMYASYFVLFAQFLFSRYCLRRGGGGNAKAKKLS